ncbi:MAG TPA: carbohydrate-binding family 9-like protein [Terriglobales bacterium]
MAALVSCHLLDRAMMSQTSSTPCASSSEVIAARVQKVRLDAAHPDAQWSKATPVTFCADWQGKNPDPDRQTEVRVLWSPQTLYLRFECRYRELNVFSDSDANGRRDQLWDRDVAETFLQPDSSQPRYYKEFEVAPNGMWIDLDISPGPRQDLKSGLERSVSLDAKNHAWAAELAIPMRALASPFDPKAVWRANFFRVEGPKEPRTYMAWQATNTPKPNFHVPSVFGRLRFKE